MGRIGNFGKLIVFETSDSRILNFTDYQRTISAVQQGRVEKLVIGNHAVGANRWKITQATQSNLIVMGTGEIQKMDVNLSLEEYL